MPRSRSWVWTALLLSVAAQAQVDRGAFTFTDYQLEVHITPATQELSAKGTVRLRNDSKTPQRHAFLQISSTLAWKTILQSGKAVQYLSQEYTTDIDHTGAVTEAIVTLARAAAPGEEVELAVEYGGTVPLDATRLTRIGIPEGLAAHNDWDRISEGSTAVRGVGYVAWYPVAIEAVSLSNGNEVFEALGAWKGREAGAAMWIRLTATVQDNRAGMIVSNDVVPRLALDEGFGGMNHVSRDLVYQPLGQVAPTFAVGGYQEVAEAQAGTVVHYLPGHASAASDYAVTAGGVANLVTGWFGTLKRRVHVVELPDANAAPYDAGAVLFTPLRTMERKTLQVMLAHQMAHAALESPRPWIYEGLATFAQALERENQDGREAALAYLQAQLPMLAATEKQLRAAPAGGEAREHPLIDATDEVLVRTKAMDVWWMLRDLLGDAALQRAIQRYRAAEDVDPAYMQRLLEAEGKKPLGWFFDDWVYHDRGLPDLQIESAFAVATVAGAYGVTVTVENRGEAAAAVVVKVRAESGERVARVQVGGKQKAVVRIAVPARPVEATVNDGSVPDVGSGLRIIKVEVAKQ